MKELECIICRKSENIIDYEFLGFSVCDDGDCGSSMEGIITNLDTYGKDSKNHEEMFKKIRLRLHGNKDLGVIDS